MKPPSARQPSGPIPARLELCLPRGGHRLLGELAVAAWPAEACGLLVGMRHEARVEVSAVLPAVNRRAAEAPDRYEIDPEDVLAADRAARESGLMLVGAWHSHPGTPATPSARDRAEAWPDWCYLIVSTDAERARELRAWRLIDGRFVEDAVATWVE